MGDEKREIARQVPGNGVPGKRASSPDVFHSDGSRLPAILRKRDLKPTSMVARNEFVAELSKKSGIPACRVDEFEIDTQVINILPKDFAVLNGVFPLSEMEDCIIMVTSDPHRAMLLEPDLQFRFRKRIEWLLDTPEYVEQMIANYYGPAPLKDFLKQIDTVDLDYRKDNKGGDDVDDVTKAADTRVIRIVDLLLQTAVNVEASDIHVEMYESRSRVRMRVDGKLKDSGSLQTELYRPVISRIKILADCNIAERRKPQDGHIKVKIGGNEVDFRVSIMPMIYGEKAVLRVQNTKSVNLTLNRLGFTPDELKRLMNALYRPQGIILVTGPTGSGKSTTLYSSLLQRRDDADNIVTIEDPVEIPLDGINQSQVDEAANYTFNVALRSLLRQDPDIVMVGEIRDFETAEIAVQAAMTGHLVLSTLHTNDSAATIIRLTQMGIEPYLVADALTMICAQRLVRKVCPKCVKEFYQPADTLMTEMGISPVNAKLLKFERGTGKSTTGGVCQHCQGTGFKGRTALYELLLVTREIKNAITEGRSAAELRDLASKQGMKTLRQAGLEKVLARETTLEEVGLVTMDL